MEIKSNIIRCSFDFDSTLDNIQVQDYAKELIQRGIEVVIVTSRDNDLEQVKKHSCVGGNRDLYKIAADIGINEIYFTNYKDKWDILHNIFVLWHLDDDTHELECILTRPEMMVKPVLYNDGWKHQCENIIEEKLKLM